jgi:hypothetical protein
MIFIDPHGPLTEISPDTVRSLIAQATLYIDSITRDYRTTPPERQGDGLGGEGYVSGRDVEQWPDKLARFREKWEARSAEVRNAILGYAHPRKCFWIDPAQDPREHGGYVPSLVIENKAGHTPLTGDGGTGSAAWTWGSNLNDAERVCAQQNADTYGLSKRDALDIVMSSMRVGRSNPS